MWGLCTPGQHSPCVWPSDSTAGRLHCGASWPWRLPPTVIQWDLLGNLAATEAEDSPAPQKVPPIPKRPCPLASSFLSSVFQRGWRLAAVPQLAADRRKWAWTATGGTSVSGSRCGRVWRQVVGPRRTLGGRLVKRGEDRTMPGGGTGWFVINRQGGYFTGVERFSQPPLLWDSYRCPVPLRPFIF